MEIISHVNFVPTVITTVLVFFLSFWSFRFINAFLQDNSLAIKAVLFLFAVVIAVARKTRSAEITSFGGMFRYAPGLTVAMTVFDESRNSTVPEPDAIDP